ncbi:hypothetical protein [Rhizohabitans arisaemae]|uniref:hypothetical protein n=1 Tax=Rhizohabitans arisaemae TaxID=2720610 RepID=UPI0024B1B996|nr:hypothetical protein [Rhizohabitans arisaemae]
MVIMGAAGCTVPPAGYTGLSVDDMGRPIIVLAWCDGFAPDGVTVYHDEKVAATDGSSPYPSTTSKADARFTAPTLDGQTASFRLDISSNGWDLDSNPPVFKPGVTYSAYGWTYDNSTSTAHVEFKVEDIGKLRPGSVMAPGGAVVSQEEFDQMGRESSYCSEKSPG